MKVFLDTNVFYNDWFLSSANFKYLFHFLNNEGHELILSKLVVQEVENIRNREVNNYLSEIKKSVKKLQKLNSSKIDYNEDSLGITEYKLIPLIEDKLEAYTIFDYQDIKHEEVVERALLSKKPFLEGEKGYRDTLIWLSFLNHLVTINAKDEEAVFITENKSDFFKVRDKVVSFHEDLAGDIIEKNINLPIKAYTSLFNFVNSTIDKDEHAIDKFRSEDIFEEFVEESAIDFIQNMSNKDLSQYYESSVFDSKVKDILDIRVDVWEGLEDPEFMYTKQLDGNDIYVSYRYNLRRVIVEIDIPELDYQENKEELRQLFIGIETSAKTTTLTSYVRPYFDVSFICNDRDDTFKDYEVADLWLRR